MTFLIRLAVGDAERFIEWSSASDTPCSPPMTETQLREYVAAEYGRAGVRDLDDRIDRCRSTGVELRGVDLESILLCNRCGDDGEALPVEQLLQRFVRAAEP